MGVKVKIKINTKRLIEITDKKAKQFIAAANGIAATKAMKLTPREYGTLANSQYTTTTKTAKGFRGSVGYAVAYAKYLNGLPGFNKPEWNPRKVKDKKGPSTNMKAEPEFLNKGFTSSASKKKISAIFKAIMRL